MSQERSCPCKLCAKWNPLIERIHKILRNAGGEHVNDDLLFDELVADWQTQSMDLGAAEAKLEGTWPGWEWMKEARKQHGM